MNECILSPRARRRLLALHRPRARRDATPLSRRGGGGGGKHASTPAPLPPPELSHAPRTTPFIPTTPGKKEKRKKKNPPPPPGVTANACAWGGYLNPRLSSLSYSLSLSHLPTSLSLIHRPHHDSFPASYIPAHALYTRQTPTPRPPATHIIPANETRGASRAHRCAPGQRGLLQRLTGFSSGRPILRPIYTRSSVGAIICTARASGE